MKDWTKALDLCHRINSDPAAREKLSIVEKLRLIYFKIYSSIMVIESNSSPRKEVFDVERNRRVNEITMELQDMHKLLTDSHADNEKNTHLHGAINDYRELLEIFNSKKLHNSGQPSTTSSSTEEGHAEDSAARTRNVEVGQQLLREGKYKEAYQWHSAAISSQPPHPSAKPELCELLSGRARASAGLGEQKQVLPLRPSPLRSLLFSC